MLTFPYPNQRYTSNLGLALFGMDEVLADNMNLIDAAYGIGSSINVDGTLVTSPNLSSTTPAAPVGEELVHWQVDIHGNISAYVPIPAAGGVTSFNTRTGAVTPQSGDYSSFYDAIGAAATAQSNAEAFATSAIAALVFPATTAAVSHQWLASYNATTGAFTQTQPAYSDISGTPTLPANTPAVSHQFVTAYNSSTGAFTQAQPAYSDISGTPQLAQTIAAVSSKWLNSYTASTGVFTATQPAASDLSNGTTGTGAVVLASAISGFGSGTVTSFSAGNLSPLFTTSVATASTTPALTFSLSNAAGGTVFGNATASAAAPGYTIAPVLGIPGTSTGSIALASSTASGKFTITAPASAATPTFTLPTSSGVAVNVADGTVFTATIGASGTLALATQTANYVFAGPTSGAAAAPTFRALVAADIPSGYVLWSALGNAGANLTLSNAAYTTEFDQTSAATWLWKNTTTATVSTTNASPLLELAANYWTAGSASAADTWSLQSSLAAGTNGASTLTIAHSGSTGIATLQTAAVLNLTQSPVQTQATLTFGTDTNTGWHQANGQLGNWTYMYAGYNSFTVYGNNVRTDANGIFAFSADNGNTASGGSAAASDSGTSRIGAASLAIGNGTAGDYSGSLKLTTLTVQGKIGTYNAIATVSNGVPSELATVDLTAQSAAISAYSLYTPAASGMFRISWTADITTAATTSSVLGGTNGFQVTYTSPTDSMSKTTVAGNSITSSANTTGTALGGTIIVYAKTGVAMTFSYGYTSVGATAMSFEIHVKVEAM